MDLKVIIYFQVRLYAEGIARLLEQDAQLRVIGIACNEVEIKKLMTYEPDVIVTDMGSIGSVFKLLPSTKDKKVLLLNAARTLTNQNFMSMIAEGLGGILPLDADLMQLLKAIRKLHDGELWFDRHTVHDFLSGNKEEKSAIRLTKKEFEILKHICKGMSNKEIACKLFVSEQTVKSHCNHLFKKFGVSSRLKLAVQAPICFPESFNQLSQMH